MFIKTQPPICSSQQSCDYGCLPVGLLNPDTLSLLESRLPITAGDADPDVVAFLVAARRNPLTAMRFFSRCAADGRGPPRRY